MMDSSTTVCSLLLQGFHADKTAARLLHALEELASRVEAAEGVVGDAGRTDTWARQQQGSSTSSSLSNTPLPDPARGPLPLLPGGACEHAALQESARDSSRSLKSTAERRIWRSWVMLPQHVVHVVEAAWLLVALVFRQEDVCAAAVQAHVCQQIQRHHVSAVLSGREPLEGCSQLWTDTLADAACRLLRSAFPAVPELRDAQLQQVLQRQLRLYTTGLLPSDAAAPVLRAAKQHQQQHGHSLARHPDDTSTTADAAVATSSGQQSSTSSAELEAVNETSTPRRHTAKFVSVKPGPAVSAFMASQGMQPSPDLLQAHAGELNRITLPSGLLQQQAREQQQCAENVAAAAAVAGGLMIMMNSGGSQAGAGGDCSSSSSGGHRAKAAACVAAASDAVAAYEQRRAVCAASVRAGSLSAQMQVQALQRQRAKAIAAGASTAKETSNRVAGWLTEEGAATVCMPVKAAAAPSSAQPTKGKNSAASPPKAAVGRGTTTNSSSASSRPLATDTQCKAQRHVLEGQLRAGDWRMARAFNATLHDTATNMAAAVATLPPAPITPMLPAGAAAAAGQDWGVLVSSSVARSHVGAGGAAAARSARSSNNIKVTKAARAIVEGVQRDFAASTQQQYGFGKSLVVKKK